jgi:excisionase family DNA binding protein
VEKKEVLDVEEAAQLLSVSPWTVREQARQGRLPGRKVGKEWRFSRQGLLQWLRVGAVGAGTNNPMD